MIPSLILFGFLNLSLPFGSIANNRADWEMTNLVTLAAIGVLVPISAIATNPTCLLTSVKC